MALALYACDLNNQAIRLVYSTRSDREYVELPIDVAPERRSLDVLTVDHYLDDVFADFVHRQRVHLAAKNRLLERHRFAIGT